MTIKQIAEKAGVSVASVSNVINGNFHKVSAQTRERIEKIIAESDYTPNAMARSLATQQSNIISLVIPNIGDYFTFNENPYYADLIAEIEKYVRGNNYCLMIRCIDRCRDIVPLLSSWNVDGALFAGVSAEEIREVRRNLRCPAVFIDSYCEDDGVACVGIDDYRGGYLSAQHLLNCGHRKIAFAAPRFGTEGVIWERFCGFRDACAEQGVTLEKDDIFEVDAIESNSIIAGNDIALSPKRFTAVGVMSDVSACGIVSGLRQCGRRVPEDISVIGFDNLSICNFCTPKLTTISQDIEMKAHKAGDLLMRMIAEKKEITVCAKIPVKLKERDSVVFNAPQTAV
ncbi:MAG: LacI family DNA-binding transcriptional regulator [Ruminococcus sp.]|nr:LacI family DNA-binding transcriptional regulator [Ruminococcus sp.]